MSTDAEVDALRRGVDLVAYISQYLQLTKNGAEFRAICPFHPDTNPSLTVSPAKQIWACFSCCQHEEFGADVFGFVRSYFDCSFPDAVLKLQNGNGAGTAKPIIRPALKKAPPRQMLVPPEGSMPDMEREDLGSPVKVWTIRTPGGEPWFYEARYMVAGRKETRFWSLGRYSDTDLARWECKHPSNPRPFFGLDELARRPTAQVMIHEAPKKAEAGQALFPKLVHLGIVGGVYQAQHMDLTPLTGRRCILLPDNDEAGKQAMSRLAPLLWAAGAAEVKGVDPETLPDGSLSPEAWDIADAADWTPAIALEWAKARKMDYPAPEPGKGGTDDAVSTATERSRSPADAVTGGAHPPNAQDAPEPPATHPRGNGEDTSPPSPAARVQALLDQARAELLATMVHRKASTVTLRATDWLWPGKIPLGEICVIQGDPGLGKSQITASLTAIITRGGQWPLTREPCQKGSVVILSAEDSMAKTIVPRLAAAGADLERVTILQAIKHEHGTRGFSLLADMLALEALLNEEDNPMAVIVDPISAYQDTVGAAAKTHDSHKNVDVRSLLRPVSELVDRRNITMILINHLTKGSGRAITRGQGNMAFVAGPRAVWQVSKDKDDPRKRLFLPVKNNLADDSEGTGLSFTVEGVELGRDAQGKPINTSRILWNDEKVTITADEAAGYDSLSQDERGSVNEAQDFLREALAEGRVKVKDIENLAKSSGHTHTTLGRAKRALGIISEREGFGREAVYYWRMRETAPPAELPGWVKDD